MVIVYNVDENDLLSSVERQMAEARSTYKSYLLRLWRDDVPGAPWRASLERVAHGGERHHFPDLDSLVAFLLAELGPARSLPGSGGQVDEVG